MHHSLQCNSRIDDSDSFKSNVGSNYDGEKYSFSPQNKNEERIEHGDLKYYDDEDDIEACINDESFEGSDPGVDNDFYPADGEDSSMCCRGI